LTRIFLFIFFLLLRATSPNFENPPSLVPATLTVLTILLAVMFSVVLLRFRINFKVYKKFGADDGKFLKKSIFSDHTNNDNQVYAWSHLSW
jgi:hypothetical protein